MSRTNLLNDLDVPGRAEKQLQRQGSFAGTAVLLTVNLGWQWQG